MKSAVGCQVVKLDSITIFNEFGWVYRVPGMSAIYWLSHDIQRLCHVFKEPDVVLVLMRIESNLLLFAASRIHEVVRVQISPLGIMMPDTDATAKCYVDWNILHGF
jgi:hypothetical protein